MDKIESLEDLYKRKFDLVSSFRIRLGSGPCWAHPVIHNGYLYIIHGKALMVYDIKAER